MFKKKMDDGYIINYEWYPETNFNLSNTNNLDSVDVNFFYFMFLLEILILFIMYKFLQWRIQNNHLNTHNILTVLN
jgi:hypothetical protein